MKAILRSPFPFFDGGAWRVRAWTGTMARAAGDARPIWGSAIGVIAWPIRRRKKRWRVRCGVGASCRRWWLRARARVGVARRLQASAAAGAAGGWLDEP